MARTRRFLGIAVLVIGLAAAGICVTAYIRAAPMTLHCTRSAQVCVWQQPSLLGGSRSTALPLGSLHDSRVLYDASKSGLSTRWIVGTGTDDVELAPSTLNTQQGEDYERLARDLQRFLDSQREVFDAEVVTSTRQWSLVLALVGAFVAAIGAYVTKSQNPQAGQ